MDNIPGLVVIAVGAATLAWIVSPRTGRGLDMFAAAFLPWRGDGWPQGVQEEDPVPWSWSAAEEADPAGDDRETALGDGPEVVEITRGVTPVASPVHPGRLVRGTATRFR